MTETEKPKVEVKYRDTEVQPLSGVDIEQIDGLFGTVSAVPTDIPRRMHQQIRTLNGIVYIYDTDTLTWIPLGQDTVYGGVVAANGTAGTPFPTGWTAATTGTGFYTVTHNLGHTNYAFTVFVYSTSVRAVNITNKSSTVFSINVKNSGGTDTDNAFEFILKDAS